tara:strand:+ start:199 stop:483 length:285 start_codon:yes stop_codon:yes gene_type:complete
LLIKSKPRLAIPLPASKIKHLSSCCISIQLVAPPASRNDFPEAGRPPLAPQILIFIIVSSYFIHNIILIHLIFKIQLKKYFPHLILVINITVIP